MRVRRWPVRREAWKVSVARQDGQTIRMRQLVSIELWPALVGWWVCERYGRVTVSRWRWRGRDAQALFDEAVEVAESFADAWPVAERRSVLPLGVRCGR